jgi:hypothetical protein
MAIKWRKEKKILKQLESLASRLQLTATTPNTNMTANGTLHRQVANIKDVESDAGSIQGNLNGGEKCLGGLDNHGYNYFGSQNEFDASIFGMNPSQYIGPPISTNTMGEFFMI